MVQPSPCTWQVEQLRPLVPSFGSKNAAVVSLCPLGSVVKVCTMPVESGAGVKLVPVTPLPEPPLPEPVPPEPDPPLPEPLPPEPDPPLPPEPLPPEPPDPPVPPEP